MADGRESPDAEALPEQEGPGRGSPGRESPESWMPNFIASGADASAAAAVDWCKSQMPVLQPQETHVLTPSPGAWTIEQAARTAPGDFGLPKRPRAKKNGEGNAAWLRDGLGIQDDPGASDRAATNAAVRGAAGRGKIKILSSLYDEGQWDPWRCRMSVEAADEGGYLLELLKAFLVHLSWYPSFAEDQEQLALEELATAPEPNQRLFAKSPLERELTQRTCLLSNLMLVNSPMAARVLDKAAEEMVVFRADAFEPVRRYPHKPFPATLGLLYLKRRVKEKDGVYMKYDRGKRELYLPGATTPTSTSVEGAVTLPRELKADFLVPLTAENYCFVYPCPELPTGGFLYIDTDGGKVTPLGVNEVSHTPAQQAFAFDDPIHLNAEHTRLLSDDLHDITPFDPAAESMMAKGALQYAWVMKLDGMDLGLGGFAYTFSDTSMNRIFPLKAAGEVLRTANLSWEVNAHALGLQPSGREIQNCIAPRGEDQAAPVSIMRITAPDVLHPMMLHGLAYTPREDVLQTDVAKAISYAAFNRAFPFYIQQAAFDCVSAGILFHIALEVHYSQQKNGIVEWTFDKWQRSVSFSIIVIVLLKNAYEEIRRFIGFWKCKWMKEYMNSGTLKDWVSMVVVAMLVWQLLMTSAGSSQDAIADEGYLRTVLAFAGFFKWIKVVHYFRGILFLRLGQKYLPISYTLAEGFSFLVVMWFFILAAWHAFFSLYPTSESSSSFMLSMTYNLGFFGDFDLDDIVSPESNAGEVSYSWVQQIFFAGAAMLLLVMLTNIYIGVMGIAYETYREKALVLFVRARASICLDIAMQYGDAWKAMCGTKGRKLEDEFVWFCRADADYDLADEQDDSNAAVRESVRKLQESMEKQMQGLRQELSEQNPGLAVGGTALGGASRTSHVGHRASAFSRPMTSPGGPSSAGGVPDGRPPATVFACSPE